MTELILWFILKLIVVLMPLIIALVPGVKSVNVGAFKNRYFVTIEKHQTKKKTRKKKK